MTDEKKKVVQVVVILGCFILAGIITATQMGWFKGGKSKLPSSYWLMCESCEKSYEVSLERLKEMYREANPNPMMSMMQGPPALICEQCGEKAAYRAENCQECGAIFISDWQAENDLERDRCPECGYSKLEDALSESEEE